VSYLARHLCAKTSGASPNRAAIPSTRVDGLHSLRGSRAPRSTRGAHRTSRRPAGRTLCSDVVGESARARLEAHHPLEAPPRREEPRRHGRQAGWAKILIRPMRRCSRAPDGDRKSVRRTALLFRTPPARFFRSSECAFLGWARRKAGRRKHHTVATKIRLRTLPPTESEESASARQPQLASIFFVRRRFLRPASNHFAAQRETPKGGVSESRWRAEGVPCPRRFEYEFRYSASLGAPTTNRSTYSTKRCRSCAETKARRSGRRGPITSYRAASRT
jgi:hypothetical protein